ncbi:MAG: hypothetical protein R3Y04_08890 [Rikenellaceae bacterium]
MITKTNKQKVFNAAKEGANYSVTSIVRVGEDDKSIAIDNGVITIDHVIAGDFELLECGTTQINCCHDGNIETVATYIALFIEELKGVVE